MIDIQSYKELSESPIAEIYYEIFGEEETEQFLGSLWKKIKKHGRPIMLGIGLMTQNPQGNWSPVDPFAEKRKRDAMVEQQTQSRKPYFDKPPGNREVQEMFEDEFNLRRFREKEKLSNDKHNLRQQAREMVRRAMPHLIPRLNTMQVDHIIPLEFIHLFKLKFNPSAGFKMDDFMHPNAPGNLRLVGIELHKWITKQWSVFKNSLPKDWNKPENQKATFEKLKVFMAKLNSNVQQKGGIPVDPSKLSLTNFEFSFNP